MDLYYGLIYITFAACEGALGLSILVIIRRTHGGDYFFNINLFTQNKINDRVDFFVDVIFYLSVQ